MYFNMFAFLIIVDAFVYRCIKIVPYKKSLFMVQSISSESYFSIEVFAKLWPPFWHEDFRQSLQEAPVKTMSWW